MASLAEQLENPFGLLVERLGDLSRHGSLTLVVWTDFEALSRRIDRAEQFLKGLDDPTHWGQQVLLFQGLVERAGGEIGLDHVRAYGVACDLAEFSRVSPMDEKTQYLKTARTTNSTS